MGERRDNQLEDVWRMCKVNLAVPQATALLSRIQSIRSALT